MDTIQVYTKLKMIALRKSEKEKKNNNIYIQTFYAIMDKGDRQCTGSFLSIADETIIFLTLIGIRVNCKLFNVI